MKWIAITARILLGLVFIFSGFVKGVDPQGTAYRIVDYFVAYGVPWAEPVALSLSVFLCAVEFSLGILLVINVKPRLISWLSLLLMAYFTVLTFYDALYNPVPDCGCFGDAIKLTNWETFYKNIVLIILAIIVFRERKRSHTPWSSVSSTIWLWGVPVVFSLFSVYNYRNLPVVDFTAWKPGTRLVPDTVLPASYYLVYQNASTGDIKEFLSNELPWQDTAWMAAWSFKEQRVVDPNHYPVPNFKILDTLGNDLTMNYLQDPSYVIFLGSVEMNPVTETVWLTIKQWAAAMTGAGYTVIGLTASLPEDIHKVCQFNHLDMPWFQSDDTELKTMVRSNPGILLIKHGRVVKKWHYRNLPEPDSFIKDYPMLETGG